MIISPLGAVEETTRQPSRTYQLNMKTGRISGNIDGIEAVKQFVFKALSTERFSHFIYSGNFGHEVRTGGENAMFEIERWIREALTHDDRITGIEGFETKIMGDEAEVSFTVVSIYGDFEERRTFQNV